MTKAQQPGGVPVLILILAGGGVLIGLALLAVAAFFLIAPAGRGAVQPAEELVAEVTLSGLSLPTATVALPSATPAPTDTAEPTPTETPAGSPTPAPTNTSAPAPTTAPASNPTARPTSPPAPTATSVPPTSPPVPTTIEGLSNFGFSVNNPNASTGERIYFQYSITNTLDSKVTMGFTGVAVFDAAGNNVRFHASWTGWEMEARQTMPWNDSLEPIGTPGTYKLYLSACFPSVDACQTGVGRWANLAGPVTVTIY